MSEDNQYDTLHQALDNSGDDEAVVNLGIDKGFKVIPQEQW